MLSKAGFCGYNKKRKERGESEVNELTKQIISESVAEEYARVGITADPASLYESDSVISGDALGKRKKEMPTIGSWYKRIVEKAKQKK